MSLSLATSGLFERCCPLTIRRLVGHQGLRPRRFDEMQHDREKRVRLADPADVDDAGVLQLLGENVDDELEYVVIERTERAVDEHPSRLLNQDARKRKAQLLVLTEFPVPAAGLIEQWREAFQAKPIERAREGVGA